LSNRFRAGDKVKLTERAARGWNNGQNKTGIDWTKRYGVVLKTTSKLVYVIWDGNRTVTVPVPPHTLELCKD
jgi:hypothetical protein